ncbi:MAG: adenine nucleotide alpha hydrolase family protein [Chloroflexi bacterium]|nr:adenine nucleotide alpha hydrolase family protein [Chloroflexota bacterium]
MRCLKCKGTAQIELRQHHAAYCRDHFLDFVRSQVQRSIERLKMCDAADTVMVAVSGGKDSLSLWDLLHGLGYRTSGLHIQLGIGDYSRESREKTAAFAQERELPLTVVSVEEEYGASIPVLARAVRREPCSACGLSKRYIMNRAALEAGATVLATGHNLDDEVATLYGNVMHWQTGYLARQAPVLPATHPGLVKKVKPLHLLTEREMASYALLRGIDYIVEECPHAQGAKSLLYKDALNLVEAQSPGTKQQFYQGFLERLRPLLKDGDGAQLRECERCGQVTTGAVCSFCSLWDRARLVRQPVP